MRKIGHTKSRVESRQAWSLFVVCLLLSLMGLHGSAYGQASQEVIKANLIRHLTRTGYYRYRNGSRPVTPDVEAYIRQLLKAHGITQEPHFDGYTEDYVW